MLTRIRNGALAGVVGGIAFGILMAMMGMLKMIASIIGSQSTAVGWVIHLMISAMIGIGFAIVFHNLTETKSRSVMAGLIYGAIWWVLGPLTLMPLMMGMGLQWSAAAASAAMPSLVGHLIYGLILGWTYSYLASRDDSRVNIETR